MQFHTDRKASVNVGLALNLLPADVPLLVSRAHNIRFGSILCGVFVSVAKVPILSHAFVLFGHDFFKVIHRFRFVTERVIAAALGVFDVDYVLRKRSRAYLDVNTGVVAHPPFGQLFGQFFRKIQILQVASASDNDGIERVIAARREVVAERSVKVVVADVEPIELSSRDRFGYGQILALIAEHIYVRVIETQ